MGMIYVARSARLGQWASDVGLSKHLYKIGCTEEPVKPLVAAGWCGETDWILVRSQAADGIDEADLIERLKGKEKLVEPRLYPRLKGADGIFKVLPVHVENHLTITRALAGELGTEAIKLKPGDFAAYLIHNATRQAPS